MAIILAPSSVRNPLASACRVGIRALSSRLANRGLRVSQHRYVLTPHHSIHRLASRPARVVRSKDHTVSAELCSALPHGTVWRRAFATERDGRHPTEPQDPPPTGDTAKPPLAQTIDATRQRSKDLTAKVKSSLSSLTPHENIYNIPNFLTASRLIASPVIGYLVLQGELKWALGLFAYAGVTDLIDGWMARRYKLQTVVGSVIDPMADKVLMTVLTITLAIKGLLPVYLATLILGRDVSLSTAAIYYRYASLPFPKTFSRYWDFSLPSAEVHPTTMSKFNTLLQLVLIGSTLAVPVLTAHNHHLGVLADLGLEGLNIGAGMTGFQYLVAATTVWSGLSYAYLKNAVKILGKDEVLKAKQGRRGRAIIGVTFGSVVCVAAWLALNERSVRDENDVLVARSEMDK